MSDAHSKRVEIGVGLQSDKAPGAYAELGAAAEAAGFDVVSVFSDLLYQPPIAALIEVAGATDRMRLGAACWNPFTMHPYEIAGQLAYLDAASKGRAYLGLARGTWLGAIGVEQPRPLTHLEEAAEFVYALLAGEPYTGREFALQEGQTLRYPVLRDHPPLLIGTWGERGAAIAGRIADELKIGGSANPAMVRVMRDRIAVGEREVGRPEGSVGIVVGAVTVVDRDGAAARALARREVAMYVDVVAPLDPTVELPEGLLELVRERVADGDDEAAGRAIPDDVLDLFSFSGTPDQVAAQAQGLIDAGVSRVEFGTPQGLTTAGGIRLIGEAVIPQLNRG